jgi:hypothetical protein
MWREPDLASQVHRFSMVWSDCDQHDVENFDGSEEVDRFIKDALDKIFLPEEQAQRAVWEEHLDGDSLCGEAWLAFLLIRLNHLRVVEFGHEHSELISDVLLKAANRQQPFHQTPPFQFLQEVRACVGWGASWIDSGFLLPFFYFPSVRTIYGTAIGESRDEANEDLDTCQTSCPVKEITVEEGYWCRGMLNWLGLCTDLEHISISVDIQADEYHLQEDEEFDASIFYLALLPFTKTLKSLRIGYEYAYQDQVVDEKEEIENPFGSFKDFEILENLTVRHDHMMQLPDESGSAELLAEFLPHSLVSLEITDIVSHDALQLCSNLSDLLTRDNCYAKLQRLVLRIPNKDEEDMDHVFENLKYTCQATNVSLLVEGNE